MTATRRPPHALPAATAALVLFLLAAPGCSDASSEAATTAAATKHASVAGQNLGPRPATVAFLVVDGVYNTELTAPLDIIQHIRFHSPDDFPQTFIVSPDGAPVRTFEGMVITPDHSFATAPGIDILVVPSAEHSMDSDLENQELLDWVKRIGAHAQHVMSLCDGAFVLARAGLLDGVAATTFPGDQDRFAEMFPKVHLQRDVSFVDAGQALTSVGGARSFDVALWLVERLYGDEVARGIGRGLVLEWDVANIPHRVARTGT